MVMMRAASQMGIRVLREMPSGADTPSHAWLLRSGFLYQHAAGVYCFTPLMHRVEQKVSDIVAEGITAGGATQLRLPILQSSEVWKQSGRWDVYRRSGLMFQFKDRRGRAFGLSPTAEEVMCDLVKHMVASVSQLPLIFFQQNFKFRDEFRPRSGLLRLREFVMMDAYSFDLDESGLDASYQAMRRAYRTIFDRLGLRYISVDADSGAIGGAVSEEFMSISEIGEDTILFNDGYAANLEQAVSTPTAPARSPDGEMAIVDTPDAHTIETLCAQLGVHPTATLKSLIFDLIFTDRVEQTMVLIRGDSTVNAVKLANHFGALEAAPSDAETVVRVTGSPPGAVGPVRLDREVRIVADLSLDGLTSLVSGCGIVDKHAVNVRPGRDFPLPPFVDLRDAQPGELAPNGKPLELCRGIEVGHVFKLGDKYSKALNAGVTDKGQVFRHFQMGCYGIGTTRLIAAVVDQNCDPEKGIVWPLLIAPFHVHVVPLKADLLEPARRICDALAAAGVESLLDDRGGSVGALMKDTDILGLPLRIVLGRDFASGKVELLDRLTGEVSSVAIEQAVETVASVVARAREAADVRARSGATNADGG